MSKRRFEFVEGKSNKFWEVEVAGADVTVRFGRIGSSGQTQTKSFDTPDQATGHAEKLIASKTKKGYLEVTCR
jgi:predicted DNA-binding WGR domain protein